MKNLISILFGLCAMVAVAGCGDDNGGSGGSGGAGGSGGSGGMTMPDASCFTNPTTHVEIINACTTAAFVDKHPTLPLQLPDGGLPPLP